MAFRVFRSDLSMYVERTQSGVRIDGIDYDLEGNNVYEQGVHVFTLDWSAKIILSTRDFEPDKNDWELTVDGVTYTVRGKMAYPQVFKDGEYYGVLDSTYDKTTKTRSYMVIQNDCQIRRL